MKRCFVLDENIIILAHTRMTDRGDPDDTCLRIVQQIIQNCHSFALTHEVWAKYSRQIETLKRQRKPMVVGLLGQIASALINAEKDTRYLQAEQLVEILELGDLANVNPGDRVFVRCAASVPGSILLTTDEPLLDDLARTSIPERYSFRALHPKDVRDETGLDRS